MHSAGKWVITNCYRGEYRDRVYSGSRKAWNGKIAKIGTRRIRLARERSFAARRSFPGVYDKPQRDRMLEFVSVHPEKRRGESPRGPKVTGALPYSVLLDLRVPGFSELARATTAGRSRLKMTQYLQPCMKPLAHGRQSSHDVWRALTQQGGGTCLIPCCLQRNSSRPPKPG